ncbi:hypothetical protein [Corynebacterium gerontici]|uniref:DUF2567 domain-containing protein n=1 Tax=Corynebacterium gerontici TaxID=2079234 RepID=A0A3G6J129_9CORY|nr:hypothetical protein [Corynebacterium gerontici]AZA11735.1 hypothetical protein CGERO_07175 [Corynebacterium gerontici]
MKQRSWIHPMLGALAGWSALILLAFIVLGLLWTPLRPSLSGTLEQDYSIALDGAAQNIQFSSWISFIAISTIASLVFTWLVIKRFPLRVGVLVWLIATLFLAGVSMVSASDVLAQFFLRDTQPGEHLDYVPPLRLGAGALVGPWVASLVYFLFMFVRVEDDPAEELLMTSAN